MPCSPIIPVQMCGLLSAPVNHSLISTSMKSVMLLVSFNLSHSPYFTVLLVDTTSAFFGKGKKSAWEAWKSYPDVTQAFLGIARQPHDPVTEESLNFKLLERYTVVLYDRTSSLKFVNEARRELFCQRARRWKLSTYPGCSTTTLQACRLPSRNLDNKHFDTAADTFSRGKRLDTGWRKQFVAARVDNP